jgi:hypothetical protein
MKDFLADEHGRAQNTKPEVRQGGMAFASLDEQRLSLQVLYNKMAKKLHKQIFFD